MFPPPGYLGARLLTPSPAARCRACRRGHMCWQHPGNSSSCLLGTLHAAAGASYTAAPPPESHPRHITMVGLAYVLLLAATSLSSASGTSLLFDSAGVTVEPGNPLELSCGVHGHFRHCLWESEDGRVFQVEDVHAGLHPGLRAPDNLTLNQCGVVLDSATEEDSGTWSCRVFLAGATLKGEKSVGERQTRECQLPFMAVGNGCYYFQEDIIMNWDDAREYCRGLSITADLAVLDDCHQFQLVWNYILLNYGARWHWIGGTDRNTEGTWHWVDGSLVPMGPPFWHVRYPNGGGNCIPLSSVAGYFVDYPCENSGPFICEELSSAAN